MVVDEVVLAVEVVPEDEVDHRVEVDEVVSLVEVVDSPVDEVSFTLLLPRVRRPQLL